MNIEIIGHLTLLAVSVALLICAVVLLVMVIKD